MIDQKGDVEPKSVEIRTRILCDIILTRGYGLWVNHSGYGYGFGLDDQCDSSDTATELKT